MADTFALGNMTPPLRSQIQSKTYSSPNLEVNVWHDPSQDAITFTYLEPGRRDLRLREVVKVHISRDDTITVESTCYAADKRVCRYKKPVENRPLPLIKDLALADSLRWFAGVFQGKEATAGQVATLEGEVENTFNEAVRRTRYRGAMPSDHGYGPER